MKICCIGGGFTDLEHDHVIAGHSRKARRSIIDVMYCLIALVVNKYVYGVIYKNIYWKIVAQFI